MLLQSTKLNRVVLVSGDGVFTRAVLAAHSRGCRVEVAAVEIVSTAQRCEADIFFSGYIIPNWVSTARGGAWGELGSRVRRICYADPQECGLLRCLDRILPDLGITDTRRAETPYQAVYLRNSNLPPDTRPEDLPGYRIIFESQLAPSSRREGSPEAVATESVSRLQGRI